MPRKPPKFRRKSTDGSPAPGSEEKVVTGAARSRRAVEEDDQDFGAGVEMAEVVLPRLFFLDAMVNILHTFVFTNVAKNELATGAIPVLVAHPERPLSPPPSLRR